MLSRIFGVGSAILLALLPFHSHSPSAGSAVRMDIEALVDTAQLVLEGRVLMARTSRDERGRIVTDYELDVQRTFSGAHRARRTLRLPGGVLPEGEGLLIPGLPGLAPGEDVILALSASSSGGTRWITGLSQGKFRVLAGSNGQPVAVRGGAGSSLLTPGGGHSEGSLEALPYAELVARLEAAANLKSQGGGR